MSDKTQAQDVPLTDRLRSIPEDARAEYKIENGYHLIPYGRFAREAVEEIEDLRGALEHWRNRAEALDGDVVLAQAEVKRLHEQNLELIKALQSNQPQRCANCNGSGKVGHSWGSWSECDSCNGKGF